MRVTWLEQYEKGGYTFREQAMYYKDSAIQVMKALTLNNKNGAIYLLDDDDQFIGHWNFVDNEFKEGLAGKKRRVK